MANQALFLATQEWFKWHPELYDRTVYLDLDDKNKIKAQCQSCRKGICVQSSFRQNDANSVHPNVGNFICHEGKCQKRAVLAGAVEEMYDRTQG